MTSSRCISPAPFTVTASLTTHSRRVGPAISSDFIWGTICGKGGTTYGAIDCPGGPSMAAVLSPGGPSMATKIATTGPGGTIGGVTAHKTH